MTESIFMLTVLSGSAIVLGLVIGVVYFLVWFLQWTMK